MRVVLLSVAGCLVLGIAAHQLEGAVPYGIACLGMLAGGGLIGLAIGWLERVRER